MHLRAQVNAFSTKALQRDWKATALRNTLEDVKASLLRFVSSELVSHASSFVGLSILLFTYLGIIQKYFPARPFSLDFSVSWDTLKYVVLFIMLAGINMLIIHALCRLVYYGRFAWNLIQYDKPAKSSSELWRKVNTETMDQNIITRWFARSILSKSAGTVAALMGSIAVSLIFVFIFLFE